MILTVMVKGWFVLLLAKQEAARASNEKNARLGSFGGI